MENLDNKVIYFISNSYPPLGRGGPMIRAYFTKYLDLEGWKVKVITVKNPSGFFIKYVKDESLLKQISSRIDVHSIKTFNWWLLGEVGLE